jgi:peptide/nickel transport system substrate-binding protein
MRGMWHKAALWVILAVTAIGTWACRPQEVVVDKEVTREVVQPVTRVSTVVVTAERTVIVTDQETVQVIVTATPTPLPQGGFVTRAAYEDAQTANPLLAVDDVSHAFCDLMFEGLLRVEPFTGELIPNFAEGWTVSDDGRSYTFTLRPDLTWSDGEPITANDFWFSYAALQSGGLDTPNVAEAAPIEQIEVIDERTFTVTFAQADCGNLEHLRLGWLPAHVFTDDVASYDFGELAGHEFNSTPTVFSGPFGLKEWVRGDHWTQVRNDRYWQGTPNLEGIVTRVISGQAQLIELLKKGEVDIGERIRPQYLYELEQAAGVQIWKFLSDEYDFIAFQMGDPGDPQPRLNKDGTANTAHGAHPILGDVRIRQAIVHAIDRDELIAKGRVGQGISQYTNVLPAVSWAYNTALEPPAYDVGKASALLSEAGWEVNPVTGIREKDGQRLRLTLYTNAGNAVRETMGSLIREQLARVGIEVELIALDWYAFRDVLYGQTFDMALVSWSNLGVDPDDSRFWSAADDVLGQGDNFVSYDNPDLEALLVQARTAPGCDQDARAALYRQIQAQLYADQPYCWIDVPRNIVAVSDRVGGLNPGPWSVWYNVHQWYVARP